MTHRREVVAGLALAAASLWTRDADACCPTPAAGQAVVNADQTVIILWDAESKRQHFIRRASFSADGDDFGFLIPTPTQPELEESGDDAFPWLARLTAPEQIEASHGGCCGGAMGGLKSARSPSDAVNVLEQKTVAGFDAAVLEAASEQALVAWLGDHGYAFSPEVEAWAAPYVKAGWKITALRVAKDQAAAPAVTAAALRLSFDTDRPLFPYREPDTSAAAGALGAQSRLLRIYFIGDARYDGALQGQPWTGRVAWSGALDDADRDRLLDLLRVAPEHTPRRFWLTELEDPWPYALAPSDLYFSRSDTQDEVRREPIEVGGRSSAHPHPALALCGLAMLLRRRRG